MSSFDTDVMEDLFYDEAEGPARSHHFEEFEEFEGEESDEVISLKDFTKSGRL
jgi:hypothetical protein